MFEGWRKFRALWKSAREDCDARPEVNRKGDELEFLPAAVEILETPASPLGRTVSLTIVSLFVIAVAWAWFGETDIESVAQGRIIPVGQVKAIQTLDIGKVEEIYVREGQQVEQGQALVKLDPTESEVDAQQVTQDLLESRMNAVRVELLLSALDDRKIDIIDFQTVFQQRRPDLFTQATVRQLQLQQRQLNRDLELYRSIESSVAANVARQQATMAAIRSEIDRLRILKPLFEDQEKAIKGLLDKGHISALDWLASKEKQLETTQGLSVQRNRLQEAEAGLLVVRSEASSKNREFRSQQLNQLQEFLSVARDAQLTLTKAREREQNRYLRSPIDGTVQQLQIHTIGGVVQPAQTLMVVVPNDAELEVEAQLLNKDIGFVTEGLHAEIKIESFPYSRYGLISGEVRHVSRDAIEQENVGRVYPIRISLGKTRILVDNHWEELQAGMSVTVEIKTGKRRLLEYFLAPFLKYQDESLNER